ncbi:MAG: Serine phosphatase RsbU, regulator of sigma subunit [Candidatus Ozemobacter sibiricus]|uniref:Serine phosphatase RsbU, regulator of sigma subunit n=1 Tax=Candidatus Ozemobacter sibiricus TaxID=2268124 RepID=A0A367ZLY7_9BACT|nr:MAG: Serine phosphatase RsbU, regulator of sigma subunit [Candidatus Ozemobacter sibiricus]
MTRTPASSQDRSSLFLGWLGPLLIVLGLGAAPAWLLAGAIDAAGESREAAREAALGRQLESCLDAVAPLVAPAYRWGRLLDRLAQRAKAHPDPVAWLARAWPRFVRRWQAPMVATVFARDGRTLWRTTPWSVPASEARALVAGLQIRATGRFRPFHHPPHQALFAAMRRLLGHQILPDTLYMALPFNPRMVQASVQSAWPYLWFAAGEDHVLLVQARAEAMTDARSLRSWLAWLNDRRPAGHPRFGLLENGLEHWPGAPGIGQPSSAAVAPATFFANRPLSPSWWPPPPGAARAALATAQAALETRIRSGHHLFGFRQVAPRRWLIGVMPLGPTSPPRRGPDPADLPWLARLAGTIWSLLVGIWAFGGRGHRSGREVSVKGKIALLMLLATGLPLLVLLVVGVDSLAQRRAALERQTLRQMGDFLDAFDRRFPTWTIRHEEAVRRFLAPVRQALAAHPLDHDLGSRIASLGTRLGIGSFYLIASGSPRMVTPKGLIVGEARGIRRPGRRPKSAANDLEEDLLISLAGRRILREVGGGEAATSAAARLEGEQLEMLVESLLQKSMVEVIQSFFQALERITVWGFGHLRSFAYLSFLHTSGGRAPDYLFIGIWPVDELHRLYLRHSRPRLLRHALEFRLHTRSRRTPRSPLTDPLAPPTEDDGPPDAPRPTRSSPPTHTPLARVFERLERSPRPLTTMIRQGRRTYLVAGLPGRHLERMMLVAVLPREGIDHQVEQWRRRLGSFALASLVVAFLLATFLWRRVLQPVAHLTDAAVAIEHRRFDHRLPPLGNDEFGELGTIFNHALIGLEELQVARVVQASLFPATPLQTDGFVIRGRSLSMGELGGDYFDHLELEAPRCAAVIGDVAGHGLPAALTMAMARAGVLHLTADGRPPTAVVEGLNRLLFGLGAKGRRRFMTFQYVELDRSTGQATLANAGHGPALLVGAGGQSVAWIELPSYPLGARERCPAPQRQIRLDPGDVLVLTTDGLIEVRDPAGRMLGYEGLAALAQRSWHPDPRGMEERLLAGYHQHLGGQPPQDDVTLVLIARLATAP